MNSFEIGQHFLQHYSAHQFRRWPRGCLLDPMVPMTFVGSVGLNHIETAIERGNDRSGERYITVQPCFRHFDIDKVGYSSVHLSLFQMAGAFSFGQTQREDTLGKIWQFLTEQIGFDPSRLWATYFIGDTVEGHQFEEDYQTRRVWQRLGLPTAQTRPLAIEGSFWLQSEGLSGKERYRKCGPTTEVFFDQGAAHACGRACLPGCGCGRFIEIANILFIRAQIDARTGQVQPLVTPFDETVFGIERLAMAASQKASVFELDDFQWLVGWIQTRTEPVDDRLWPNRQIMADHIRALLFLAADGAPPPGKGGQARIMRKLVRGIITQQKILDLDNSRFISDLIRETVHLYYKPYPYLAQGQERLLAYFQLEAQRFEQTLSSSYRRLERIIRRNSQPVISGEQALDLVKNYGLPFALLTKFLAHRRVDLDRQAYRRAHQRWQQQTLLGVS